MFEKYSKKKIQIFGDGSRDERRGRITYFNSWIASPGMKSNCCCGKGKISFFLIKFWFNSIYTGGHPLYLQSKLPLLTYFHSCLEGHQLKHILLVNRFLSNLVKFSSGNLMNQPKCGSFAWMSCFFFLFLICRWEQVADTNAIAMWQEVTTTKITFSETGGLEHSDTFEW